MIIKQVKGDISDALKVRELVFCNEQGIKKELVFAGFDNLDSTKHFVCYDSNENPIGSLVVIDNGNKYSLKRVCILKESRRLGFGKLLLERVIELHANKPITLKAQLTSEAFYWSVGFRAEGEVFLEAGIPHVNMRLENK